MSEIEQCEARPKCVFGSMNENETMKFIDTVATRAVTKYAESVGLDDKYARSDVAEFRALLKDWRGVKKTVKCGFWALVSKVWAVVWRAITMVILGYIALKLGFTKLTPEDIAKIAKFGE